MIAATTSQAASPTRPTRRAALAALLVVACASGCGRGTAPTSPAPPDGASIRAASGSNDPGPQSGSDLRDITNEVVIATVPGSIITDIAAAFDAVVVRQDPGGFAALVPLIGSATTLAEELGLDPRVLAAQVNVIVSPAEDRQRSEAFDDGDGSPETYEGQAPVQAAEIGGAHRVTLGAGTRLAVLDTGAEMTHPALAGHIGQQWDFVSEDPDAGETGDGVDNDGDGRIDEAWGHGTHVAGIAALVAPASQLLVARVLDGDGRGDVLSIAAAIFWARTNGADVINMSLGMLSDSPVIDVAIAQAEADGITCVAAAGNAASDSPVEYPAANPSVIAVAAVDNTDYAATFTSYGPHVDISAPGVAVRSSYRGGTYALWSGTSMATPFISGVAALLRAVHPAWTRTDVVARLASASRSLTVLNQSQTGMLGAGALDASDALAPDWDVVDRGVPRAPLAP